MKDHNQTKFVMLILLALLTINTESTTFAQGTAFTYQGHLQYDGAPASGTYNFTFTLYSTNIGGSAVAGAVTNSAVNVTNALFTVIIDFGSRVWDGSTNWLQIAVETNGANSFTTLNPRQQVTPTPYAIYSANAAFAVSADAVAASNIIGSIPFALLPGSIITNTESGVTLEGSFSGDAGGLTNLNPANLVPGTAAINISGNAATATSVANGGLPAGALLPFGGTNIPFGFLVCDGGAQSSLSYPSLYSALGTAWGTGDGTLDNQGHIKNFNLPDLRGRFLRGVDQGTGRDPDINTRTASNTGGNTGDAVGSIQGYQIQAHSHTFELPIGDEVSYLSSEVNFPTVDGYQQLSFSTDSTGGNETRPINANVAFIIKY